MTPLGRLRARWDIDPERQASLSFDRAIVIVNLRRVELACLLAFVTRLLELWLGAAVPVTACTLPLTIALALAARLIQRDGSLRVQQASIVAFLLIAMVNAIWTVMEVSRHTGYVGSGFLTNLLSLAMLFVLRPPTMIRVFAAICLLYCCALFQMPPAGGFKAMATASAVMGSAIAMIASWLIYAARASDDQQKRIIRAQNAQLEARDHERDQLMAITAHDLRSPLYGLRNLLDLAARRSVADGTPQLSAMRDAVFGLDGMIVLVTRLLDAHSAEHEPLTACVTEDLRDPVRDAARRAAPAAAAAGVAIMVEMPDHPLMVTFDSIALGRILDNLLANAVRFSPVDAPVSLSCAAEDGTAVVRVEDRGPGFDAAGRAAMFAKFHPRRGVAPGGKAGTGMGLFIAASFAARMGARLDYAAVEPTGSRFSLWLKADGPA